MTMTTRIGVHGDVDEDVNIGDRYQDIIVVALSFNDGAAQEGNSTQSYT
jgi:hypothetical protein